MNFFSNQKLLIDFLVNTGGGSKRIPWSATVNVVLVEGRGLKAMDMEGTSDPYCKVRSDQTILDEI